jgi:hypothetical protein
MRSSGTRYSLQRWGDNNFLPSRFLGNARSSSTDYVMSKDERLSTGFTAYGKGKVVPVLN